jgi:hypothetical protein
LPVRGGSQHTPRPCVVVLGEDLGPPGAAGSALSAAREERARAVTARHSLEPAAGGALARRGAQATREGRERDPTRRAQRRRASERARVQHQAAVRGAPYARVARAEPFVLQRRAHAVPIPPRGGTRSGGSYPIRCKCPLASRLNAALSAPRTSLAQRPICASVASPVRKRRGKDESATRRGGPDVLRTSEPWARAQATRIRSDGSLLASSLTRRFPRRDLRERGVTDRSAVRPRRAKDENATRRARPADRCSHRA